MAEFKRKDNYNDKTIKQVRSIFEWNKNQKDENKILIIPQMDCFKAYYNGITLIDKLTDRTLRLSNTDMKVDSVGDLLKNMSMINTQFSGKMPEDRERRSSQIITLNNMAFKEDEYSVCGWEWTISINDVPGLEKKPEVDLVVLNPKKKSIILVEYKCGNEAMLEEGHNVADHCRDYNAVLNSPVIDDIIEETIKAYNVLCRVNRKEEIEIESADIKDRKVGFLFVDRVQFPDRESYITENAYNKAYEMIKDSEYKDRLCYIRCRTHERVDLNKWKPVKDPGFVPTE